MHALLIEDHGLISWLLEEELRDMGYDSFDVAVTEAQAVAAAHLHQPDLITADAFLRCGTGPSAVRTICREGAVPVVFITGDLDMARRLSVDAVVLEKPFTAAELTCAVERARVSSCYDISPMQAVGVRTD